MLDERQHIVVVVAAARTRAVVAIVLHTQPLPVQPPGVPYADVPQRRERRLLRPFGLFECVERRVWRSLVTLVVVDDYDDVHQLMPPTKTPS